MTRSNQMKGSNRRKRSPAVRGVGNVVQKDHITLTDEELATFRTRLCDGHRMGTCTDSDSCANSHCLTWQRRCPFETPYSPKLCPEIQFVKKGSKMTLVRRCNRGRNCLYAHSKEEELYHPLMYKTKMCSAHPACSRCHCPFAHSTEELRRPFANPRVRRLWGKTVEQEVSTTGNSDSSTVGSSGSEKGFSSSPQMLRTVSDVSSGSVRADTASERSVRIHSSESGSDAIPACPIPAPPPIAAPADSENQLYNRAPDSRTTALVDRVSGRSFVDCRQTVSQLPVTTPNYPAVIDSSASVPRVPYGDYSRHTTDERQVESTRDGGSSQLNSGTLDAFVQLLTSLQASTEQQSTSPSPTDPSALLAALADGLNMMAMASPTSSGQQSADDRTFSFDRCQQMLKPQRTSPSPATTRAPTPMTVMSEEEDASPESIRRPPRPALSTGEHRAARSISLSTVDGLPVSDFLSVPAAGLQPPPLDGAYFESGASVSSRALSNAASSSLNGVSPSASTEASRAPSPSGMPQVSPSCAPTVSALPPSLARCDGLPAACQRVPRRGSMEAGVFLSAQQASGQNVLDTRSLQQGADYSFPLETNTTATSGYRESPADYYGLQQLPSSQTASSEDLLATFWPPTPTVPTSSHNAEPFCNILKSGQEVSDYEYLWNEISDLGHAFTATRRDHH